MMTKDKLKALIEASVQCDYIEVKGDDGVHFEAIIVSPEFENLSMLKQHKLIYAALGNRLQTEEIHALALKTYKPSQWNQ